MDLPASCGLRRDEQTRTRPAASRCDQASTSDDTKPEASSDAFRAQADHALDLTENPTPATGRDQSRRTRHQRDAFQQTRPSRPRAVPSLSCHSRAGLLFPTTRLPSGRGVLTRLVAASRLDEGAQVVLALRSLAGASSRNDGGLAHVLSSGHMPNGSGAESETGQ